MVRLWMQPRWRRLRNTQINHDMGKVHSHRISPIHITQFMSVPSRKRELLWNECQKILQMVNQVMTWCHQARSHKLNQCWPRSPRGVIRLQWVNNKLIWNVGYHCLYTITTMNNTSETPLSNGSLSVKSSLSKPFKMHLFNTLTLICVIPNWISNAILLKIPGYAE